MRPKIVCSKCDNELSIGDKFCPLCGEPIEWEDIVAVKAKEIKKPVEKAELSQKITCDMCGFENEGGYYCEGCGAPLPGVSPQPKRKSAAAPHKPPKDKIAGKQQKLATSSTGTVISVLAGVILIGFALYIFVVDRSAPHGPVGGVSPVPDRMNQAIMNEIQMLEHQLEHEPDNAMIMISLANLYHDVAMYDPAIRYYQKYIEKNPEDADARVDLGICFFEAGQPDHAIEQVRGVTEEFPQHQLASFNLGIIFLNLGEIEHANRYFARAVEINPDNETGQRAQRIIEQHSF